MNDDHLRLSDAERDLAAADLAEHYAQGRLTAEEHAERLDRIWAARTRGEIPPIFRDLPSRFAPQSRFLPPGRYTSPPDGRGGPPVRRGGGMPTPVLVGLVLLVVLTLLTKLPLIVLGLIGWFVFVSARGSRRRR